MRVKNRHPSAVPVAATDAEEAPTTAATTPPARSPATRDDEAVLLPSAPASTRTKHNGLTIGKTHRIDEDRVGEFTFFAAVAIDTLRSVHLVSPIVEDRRDDGASFSPPAAKRQRTAYVASEGRRRNASAITADDTAAVLPESPSPTKRPYHKRKTRKSTLFLKRATPRAHTRISPIYTSLEASPTKASPPGNAFLKADAEGATAPLSPRPLLPPLPPILPSPGSLTKSVDSHRAAEAAAASSLPMATSIASSASASSSSASPMPPRSAPARRLVGGTFADMHQLDPSDAGKAADPNRVVSYAAAMQASALSASLSPYSERSRVVEPSVVGGTRAFIPAGQDMRYYGITPSAILVRDGNGPAYITTPASFANGAAVSPYHHVTWPPGASASPYVARTGAPSYAGGAAAGALPQYTTVADRYMHMQHPSQAAAQQVQPPPQQQRVFAPQGDGVVVTGDPMRQYFVMQTQPQATMTETYGRHQKVQIMPLPHQRAQSFTTSKGRRSKFSIVTPVRPPDISRRPRAPASTPNSTEQQAPAGESQGARPRPPPATTATSVVATPSPSTAATPASSVVATTSTVPARTSPSTPNVLDMVSTRMLAPPESPYAYVAQGPQYQQAAAAAAFAPAQYAYPILTPSGYAVTRDAYAQHQQQQQAMQPQQHQVMHHQQQQAQQQVMHQQQQAMHQQQQAQQQQYFAYVANSSVPYFSAYQPR